VQQDVSSHINAFFCRNEQATVIYLNISSVHTCASFDEVWMKMTNSALTKIFSRREKRRAS